MSRYSRYSHHAMRALRHAGSLVQQFRHPRVDTGHLLVGVMLTNGSIGHQVLMELDLAVDAARNHLANLTLPLLENLEEVPPNDAALDIALEQAADESRWLGHHYIGTEHLLLGITRTNVGNADDLLHLLNVSPEHVRRRVRNVVNSGAREFSTELARRNARLSELSRRVINAAEQLAVRLDHPTVGVGHLLMILARERRSDVAQLLEDCNLDTETVWQVIETGSGDALFSIESVLIAAGEFAQDWGMHYTGTEHLLLALVSLEIGQQLVHHCGGNPDLLMDLIWQEFGVD